MRCMILHSDLSTRCCSQAFGVTRTFPGQSFNSEKHTPVTWVLTCQRIHTPPPSEETYRPLTPTGGDSVVGEPGVSDCPGQVRASPQSFDPSSRGSYRVNVSQHRTVRSFGSGGPHGQQSFQFSRQEIFHRRNYYVFSNQENDTARDHFKLAEFSCTFATRQQPQMVAWRDLGSLRHVQAPFPLLPPQKEAMTGAMPTARRPPPAHRKAFTIPLYG